MVHHPPMKSKYEAAGPSAYQLKIQRQKERNEKARLRMARKRAELKTRPIAEQELAAQRSRAYQATYREKHRHLLRVWEYLRRRGAYQHKYGPDAYAAYEADKRNRKAERDRLARRRRLAALFASDDDDDPLDDDDEPSDDAPSESDDSESPNH